MKINQRVVVAAVLSAGLLFSSYANQAPGFFWVMNGKLTEEQICRQLDDMKAHGLGSVCWHPFPKGFSPKSFQSAMEPDYLTDDYLKLYAKAVDHAAENGMDFWLYDEGGWPSGGACGLVMKGTGEKYARRYLEIGPDGQPVVTVEVGDPAKRAQYPSVLEPGTTERFLELTHERIKQSCGQHFGKAIKYAFTDEPVFPMTWPGKRLGWCTDFAEQFKARKGYDLMPYVKGLLDADKEYGKGLTEPLWANRRPVEITPELQKVRIDYMDVRSQLFVERFLNPIRDWCRKNNLKSGGHFGGEDQVEGNAYYGYGHILRSLRALDCPGVDAIWRQVWPGEENIQFPRYAASAAHQTGNNTVLSETFAVYGRSMTPDEMRWTVGAQLVRGVTKFVFSGYAYDTEGDNSGITRTFGKENPMWDSMKPFFDWVSDIGEKMSKGRSDAQVAVLFDVRGIWAGGKDCTEAADAHVAASRWLDRKHVDHDFIDDDQLAAAEIKDGKLVVGEMKYAAVVVPTEKWVLPAAKAKLEAFYKAGGQVCRGSKPEGLAPTCRILGKGEEDIRVMRRRDGEKEIMLFFNESMETREVAICTYGYKRFAPGECHYWETGMPYPDVKKTETVETIGGWSPALGDWRARKGEAFSGSDTYRTTFRHAGGKAMLDLGTVCWTCRVKLNGRELEPKFFGSFVWDVELKAGENTLEVTVVNTLANAAFNDKNVPKTPYDKYFQKFDALHHESGLFGPVTLQRYVKTEEEKFVERAQTEKPFGEGYRQQWTDALNADIDARIEKHRKADFAADGFPAGAEVEVKQVTSDFQVGCNMFNFGQLGKPEWDAQYRATWEKGGIFNAATIPFYWASFEHERGKPRYISNEEDDPAFWAKFRKDRDYRPVEHWKPECPWAWRRPAPDRLIAFCQKNGVSMHGHCIIYPAWDPDWIKPIAARDLNALQAIYDQRVKDIALYYKDTLQQWDVVNENWNRKSGTEHPNDWVCVHDGVWNRRVFVPKDYTFKALKVAEKYFPKNVKVCMNDAAQDGYFALAQTMVDRGARVDVMGFQMHIFNDLDALRNAYGVGKVTNGMKWNPHYQTNVFAKIDRIGRPIHLSEVTIPSPRKLLPVDQADAIQARLVRDNFRLWFSWPSIYRITYWNLVDGTGAEILASGFYDKDLTKKAVYFAVDRLVNHEWKTNLKLKADKDGKIAFRGFKGEYELVYKDAGGKEVRRTVAVR